ncbi:hypothetical protein [Winogradskyella luteola]|uniref:Uncharacterized protein n=1 Tax=Winogradskyella luteola TaxID=2828330 RepID=A0A9X1JNX5_9FLAO|nr:hypothetical protein [Winogradskyella luteola]MBV7270100.1 hypothetical protein [Winogradskyella luteola]
MSELKDFDQFWLGKGQELVDDTFTNLNKHLINYNTYLKFLLGFYTTAGLTTVLLFKSVCPWIYIGFFLPLVVVYWALFKISVGQSISLDSLDIRSPLKINDTYNKLVINLKKDIVSAKQWVGLATFAVLIGGSITTYYLNLEIKEAEKEKVLRDAEYKKSEDLLKMENEIYKDFKKTQKLHIEVNEKDQKLMITAKLLETKTIAIEYIDIDGKTQNKAFEIPKRTDYKRDIGNVKKLIKIKD